MEYSGTETILGLPYNLLFKFRDEIAKLDTSFLIPEYEKLFQENFKLRKENKILTLKVEALEKMES